jgi:hypothetical protein
MKAIDEYYFENLFRVLLNVIYIDNVLPVATAKLAFGKFGLEVE